MFRVLQILLAVFLLASSPCCFGQVRNKAFKTMLGGLLSHSVPEIDVQAAAEIRNAIFLDARERVEYNVSRIDGALHIGYNHFDLNALEHLPRNTPVVVYCSVGYRSEKIAEKLVLNGFSSVYNLYGGIFEWVNQGRTVVCESGVTDRVHAFDKTWGVWLSKGTRVY
ncbi:MAG: rhodanese-like domain-containing protein [Bacteroidota bacterium]|jgi:rhodanese-related sulfurtransferase|nr:rhodanese-like domain-containing protein [Saprospiraceae bacterium]